MAVPSVRACFAYQHEYRVVDVESIWTSRDGKLIITGIDAKTGEYRSFRADRIQNKIRLVKR